MKTYIVSLLVFLLNCHVSVTHKRARFTHASNPVPPTVHSNSHQAFCGMNPNTGLAPGMPHVYGHILFQQSGPNKNLRVIFKLDGLPVYSQQPRALHIHEYGDLSKGCGSTGGHYNPFGVNHPQHPGDFGNFMPVNGKIYQSRNSNATLFGRLSIIGRSVVIHEGKDDLGRGGNVTSLLNGNAGGRLACCVIGLGNSHI